jgi:hypothetical protein
VRAGGRAIGAVARGDFDELDDIAKEWWTMLLPKRKNSSTKRLTTPSSHRRMLDASREIQRFEVERLASPLEETLSGAIETQGFSMSFGSTRVWWNFVGPN